MVKLFSKNIPLCKTNGELFELKKQYSDFDDYYFASAVIEERKEFFETLWSKYETYADANFLDEIPFRFSQRVWEMWLGNLMLENGKILKKPNKKGGADLVISSEKNIHIECVVPEHGKGADAVPEMMVGTIENMFVQDVPEQKIVLRVRHSLKEKFEQYQQRLQKGLVDDTEPYIIAVNTSDFGYPEHIPYALKAVFGIGFPALRIFDGEKRLENPTHHWTHRPTIAKQSGTEIDTLFFLIPEFANISAIIYSNKSVLNSRINNEPIVIIHNPLAKNPIPLSDFDFFVQYHKDKSSDALLTKLPIDYDSLS